MEQPMPHQSSSSLLAEPQTRVAEKATIRDFWILTKPGINASNLMAAFTGFWLAGHESFNFGLLLATLIGTALVIAGGCAVNNFIDRDIDPKMERTKDRAIPAGRIQPHTALWFGILLGLLGVAVLVTMVNPVAALLAATGYVVYVVFYSAWTKRTTTWNTVVGSISGAVPPMIGWAAVTGSLEWPAWILFLFMFFWQPAHFFALAIMKTEDYRTAGIPMLPVVKGFAETKKQTLLFVLFTIPISILLFTAGVVGWIYLGVAVALGIGFLWLTLDGYRSKPEEIWARRLFLYSLFYLTLMQVAMFLDPALLS
ncbi:protoheme IX farnesyltransferase [Marininema mesophilum]|uniref:Protoheme IX farnesyltransferase n=1 Tax=Marininema mesophilum TaxID=1048340 RepID=A0A1H2WGD2_9BACL|nr:heme o synthase [Marininema mesophilum]SDW79712.1 protoheme IX farnesyltransferase [Marininema mesophilum]